MATPEKQLTLTVVYEAPVVEPPYALTVARNWGAVAGVCIVAAISLAFVPDTWARYWGVVAGMVTCLAVVAILEAFRDYTDGVDLLGEEENDG
jgi:predicted RNA polymerase sigma factor